MNVNIDPKSIPDSIAKEVIATLDPEDLDTMRQLLQHRRMMQAKAEAEDLDKATNQAPDNTNQNSI